MVRVYSDLTMHGGMGSIVGNISFLAFDISGVRYMRIRRRRGMVGSGI